MTYEITNDMIPHLSIQALQPLIKQKPSAGSLHGAPPPL